MSYDIRGGISGLRTGRRFAPPTLDMTPAGEFRTPPRLPLPARIGAIALLVAIAAGAAAAAALLLWAAVLLVPLAIGAGVVAYLAFRFQIWRARRRGMGRGLRA